MAYSLLADQSMNYLFPFYCMGAISVALIVVGVVLIVLLRRFQTRSSVAKGVVVEIKVTDRVEYADGPAEFRHAVIVYCTDTGVYQIEQQTDGSHKRYQMGEAVSIYYHPDAPGRGRPVCVEDYVARATLIIGGIFLMTIAAIGWWYHEPPNESNANLVNAFDSAVVQRARERRTVDELVQVPLTVEDLDRLLEMISSDGDYLGTVNRTRRRTPDATTAFASCVNGFRVEFCATVAADLKSVVDFYRRELPARGWHEKMADAQVENETAQLTFVGPPGSLTIQLQVNHQGTAISLLSRNARMTKAADLLPPPGQARLFIANEFTKAARVTIHDWVYDVDAGAGADDFKTGVNRDVAPGPYTVKIQLPDTELQVKNLTIGPDETWGVIIFSTGDYRAVQLY